MNGATALGMTEPNPGRPSPSEGMRRLEHIVGRSPALLAALETARRVAATTLPILIVGDTGTGKELVARYIHEMSGRAGALVDVDCGALPEDLMESLLFGHRRGAFTGALEHTEGIIENADGGTLFLDELGSLPLRGQAKLLRVIETGEVRRIGATRLRSVDLRIISTMQEDAARLLADGAFRVDLMQRIAGAVLRLPPLSERSEDVVPLARHFSARLKFCLDPEAEHLLQDRHWSGNIRELKWTVERATLFGEAGRIGRDAITQALEIGPGQLIESPEPMTGGKIAELRAVCRAHQGDAEKAADALGIGRSTLYRWLKEAGLELRMFKERVLS